LQTVWPVSKVSSASKTLGSAAGVAVGVEVGVGGTFVGVAVAVETGVDVGGPAVGVGVGVAVGVGSAYSHALHCADRSEASPLNPNRQIEQISRSVIAVLKWKHS
jgi:hypothetical protein